MAEGNQEGQSRRGPLFRAPVRPGRRCEVFPLKGKNMSQKYQLEILLPAASPDQADRLAFFAVLNLGFIESLANGMISAVAAVSRFYFADNCLFVRRVLKDKIADRVMSHGVQLPDLF